MTSFIKEESEEPQLVGKRNQITSSERADQVLEPLALQQGRLTNDQLCQLEQLIRQNVDIFPLTKSKLGHATIVEHHVNTGDDEPIKQLFRRIPFVHRDVIAAMVKSMKEQGVTRPSTSSWGSPVVLVPKIRWYQVILWGLLPIECHHEERCLMTYLTL